MDLLDTVSHLYENEETHERRDAPLLSSMGYSCKDEFPENSEQNDAGQNSLPYGCSDSLTCEGFGENSVDVTTVLERLDSEFRQRINAEIENFRINVDEIVSEQQMNFRTMFGLHPDMDPSQEVPIHMFSRSPSTNNISSDYQVEADDRTQAEQMSIVESPASTYNSYGTSDGDQQERNAITEHRIF